MVEKYRIQTSPIMFIKIYEKIIVFHPIAFLSIFISLLSRYLPFAPFFIFFLPFSSFYQFVKECEIKLLKECESSKLRSDVARLTTNDPFLLAPPLQPSLPSPSPSPSLSPSPPHTRESSDTFVMEERGSEEEFSLVFPLLSYSC